MATLKFILNLCTNIDHLSDPELVSRLKATQIDPGLFAGIRYGATLLHIAAQGGQSPEFCQVLHDMDASFVKTQDNDGWLPVHYACINGNIDTAMYLFRLYTGSINLPTNRGIYPLHLLFGSQKIGKNAEYEAVGLLTLLLEHDKGAVSTPDSRRNLPLHTACGNRKLYLVKLLFDAHPDGIFDRNIFSRTPLDNATISGRVSGRVDVIYYLEAQLELQRQAKRDQETDSNGQLPIHRALQSEIVSLGAIKLMIAAYPIALQ